jgi:hypothetical protein
MRVALPVAVVAATVLAFWPCLDNGFVDYDDNYLLLENPAYRGVGWAQLRWMFTTTMFGHYSPLAWLTFGLDYLVWGLDPFGYHLTSLLLHALATLLFYRLAVVLLARTTGVAESSVRLGAAAAALAFGIHPLRAESVAWATERRDVLSGVLFLGTVLLYLAAQTRQGSSRRWRLAASSALYVLALLAKSIVMTLPLLLVILDLYPLHRLPADPRRWLDRSLWPVWREKLWYLPVAVGAGVVAYYAQTSATATPGRNLLSRATNIVYSLWFYLAKTVAPIGLSPLYESPRPPDPSELKFVGAGLGVLGLTLVVLVLRRRWPAGLALWTAYAVTLAPVSGVLPMARQLVGDRYSYLACLGWALLFGAGVAILAGRTRRGALTWVTAAGALAALGWLAALGVLTWRQTQIWRDTGTLFRAALDQNPACAVCHANLGVWLIRQGDRVTGAEHIILAEQLWPDLVMAHGRVGVAYAALGMNTEAIAAYRRELGRRPRDASLHLAVGEVLLRSGQPDEAARHYGIARRLTPQDRAPRLGLIQAYRAMGDDVRAREEEEALARLEPAR